MIWQKSHGTSTYFESPLFRVCCCSVASFLIFIYREFHVTRMESSVRFWFMGKGELMLIWGTRECVSRTDFRAEAFYKWTLNRNKRPRLLHCHFQLETLREMLGIQERIFSSHWNIKRPGDYLVHKIWYLWFLLGSINATKIIYQCTWSSRS